MFYGRPVVVINGLILYIVRYHIIKPMSLKDINKIFPFKDLFRLLLLIVFFIQSTIVLYNHFGGEYRIDSFYHFIQILLSRILVGLIAAFITAYPLLIFIEYFNKVRPWSKGAIKRVIPELFVVIILSMFVSVLITLLVRLFLPADDDFLKYVEVILIYTAINLIFIAILEAWLLFFKENHAQNELKRVNAELFEIKFEVLKSQINPHFMFNSLNVLSGLIDSDTAKAKAFIDEFSSIYRYVLDYIEVPVATLSNELKFGESYLVLQQIRYGDNLKYKIDGYEGYEDYQLPPLSIQVVLENAIKHNIISSKYPLEISITIKDESLVISHIIQPRISRVESTGLGQKNLYRRYALVNKREPVFSIINDTYVAQLPLFK